jgi:type 2 lantibiotic biosynthesis protein LanM
VLAGDGEIPWSARDLAACAAGLSAEQRDRWARVVDPHDASTLARRLAWSREARRRPPVLPELESWPDELREICMACRRAVGKPAARTVGVAFEDILWPIVDHTWTGCVPPSVPPGAISPAVEQDFKIVLLRGLAELTEHALAERFAEVRDIQELRRRLSDAGPGYRHPHHVYDAFCRDQLEDGLGDLLSRYPVLGRLLTWRSILWRREVIDVLTRVARDRDEIQAVFGIPSDTPLTGVSPPAGDAHAGGRHVLILTFDEAPLVYKPRDLRVEQAFQDIVATVNDALPDAGLRTTRILAREGYGYWEFVRHRPAESGPQLHAFYENAGRLLAVLYVLGATDCHHENLVASADQPVLVDVETLFEGRLRSLEDGTSPHDLLWKGLEESVLGVGLLPAWVTRPDRMTLDPSALGRPACPAPQETLEGWHFVNTDDMTWGPLVPQRPSLQCSPFTAATPVSLERHVSAILTGFTNTYNLMRIPAVSARIASQITALRDLRRRVVLRATRVYAVLQRSALSAAALADPVERGLVLDHLARFHLLGSDPGISRRLLDAELVAMERLDVPLFEQELGSRDVVLEDGERVLDIVSVDGLDAARNRLARLSPADLGRQQALIRASVRSASYRMSADQHSQALPLPRPLTASVVVSALLDTSERGPDGSLQWLTSSMVGEGRVQPSMIPPGLYDGRAGVAAFLLTVGEDAHALATLTPVLERLAADDDAVDTYLRRLGPGMLGSGGLLRFFLYAQRLRPEVADWSVSIDAILEHTRASALQRETSTDLLTGIAGIVSPLAYLAQGDAGRRDRASSLIAEVANRLVATQQTPSGGWHSPIGARPLTGLSHGVSGIALALVQAYDALAEPAYLDAALDALAYERGQFDRALAGWPDLRVSAVVNGPPPVMHSWCHGSVGIALARTRMLDLLPSHDQARQWRLDAIQAVDVALDATPMAVDNLCCGNLGRHVGTAYVARHLGLPDRERRADDMLATLGTENPHAFPRLGVGADAGIAAPSLMTGLSGVGMHLLGDPARWVPQLLL